MRPKPICMNVCVYEGIGMYVCIIIIIIYAFFGTEQNYADSYTNVKVRKKTVTARVTILHDTNNYDFCTAEEFLISLKIALTKIIHFNKNKFAC